MDNHITDHTADFRVNTVDGFLINKKMGVSSHLSFHLSKPSQAGVLWQAFALELQAGVMEAGAVEGAAGSPVWFRVVGNRSGVSALRTVLADQEPVAEGSHTCL